VTRWNPASYDSRHGFVHQLAGGVVELLDAHRGERVLDAGAGTGHLAAQLAGQGATVVGIDASEDMVAAARRTYPAVQFEVADLRTYRSDTPFDAVFSNATLHWILEAEAPVRTFASVLRPGGRLVVEFGGRRNVADLTDALRTAVEEATGTRVPEFWFFPSIGEYASLLERHGFAVDYALLFPRPTPLQGGHEGLAAWYREFCADVLAPVPEERQADVLERAAALAAKRFVDGKWVADYVRLRLRAIRD
jgi:trans-aconitate methyltransferase